MRKILFLIPGLGTGGAERSLSELLPRLPDAGFEPIVVCLYRRTEGVQSKVLGSGVPVLFLAGHGTFSRVRELRSVLKRERPLLMHTALFEANLVGRLAAAGMSVKVLSSLVNVSYDGFRLLEPGMRAWKLALVRRIDGWTSRHLSDHIHAVAGAVRDEAINVLGVRPGRVTVVERGRDPARLGGPSPERRRRARELLGVAEDRQVVVHVGRQEFHKGIRDLLAALILLTPDRPELTLLQVGRRGDETAFLESQLEGAATRPDARLLGHRDDVPELLAAADVFVLPSLREGLSGALIEAMALGLPIVASDLPSVREVVEDGSNAILVPPRSPEELAAAIASLLDDPDRRRSMGLRGREIFEQRFTVDHSTRRMLELYGALTGVRQQAVVSS